MIAKSTQSLIKKASLVLGTVSYYLLVKDNYS